MPTDRAGLVAPGDHDRRGSVAGASLVGGRGSDLIAPYLPRLVGEWIQETPDATWREVSGSLVFADVSGFTALSEHLARLGKLGAEELTDLIGSCFGQVLGAAYANDGGLVKFGGDALLLLFTGADHAVKACRAAIGMRRSLREIGRLPVDGRRVTLRMSTGVHSGTLHLFLVGDGHRELVITGPGASTAVAMEGLAQGDEIVVSADTARALSPACLGRPVGGGYVLRRSPPGLAVGRSDQSPGVGAEQLAACLPRAVRERVLGGLDESELKLVTVAFIHFEGTDALVERSGPAEAAARISALVNVVQESAARYDVCVLATDIDHDGGKIILTAGAPTATGADEERMLLAVRRVVEASTTLPVRVGVNRGHVFAGDVGPAYRRTYTVMGDAVNLAARLMARAAPGEVLAAETVLAASKTRFSGSPLTPFRVKGKTHPIRAVAVGAPVGSGPNVDDRADRRGPLIGRQTELQALLDALEPVRVGSGRLLEIIGEPGMGKSRLVAELVERAGDLPAHTIVCEQFETSTPYFAVRRLLRTLAGIHPDLDGGAASTQLMSAVAAAGADLVPWAPLVGVVAAVELPLTAEVQALDQRFRRARLEQVTTKVLGHLLTGPALLIVEDAHWMDEASAALLHELADGLARRPWLICVTRRDSGSGFAAAEGRGHTKLRPRPLDVDEARALVEAVTESTPLAPHEVAALAARAGGNPLFLEELVAVARGAASVEELPDSVERVIVARIDRLRSVDRTLVRHLSVMGPVFERRLAAAVLPEELPEPGSPAWQRIAELVCVEDGLIRFRHALIRDAAYDGLPYRVRRRLHALVGETLEQTAGADAAVLSLHYFHSQRYEDAWRHARAAADAARVVYANVEAAELYERALQSGRRATGVSASELATVQEALGDVRRRLGEYAAATDAYRAARRLVGDDRARAAGLMLKQVRMREVAGRCTEALRWLRRAGQLLDGCEGPEIDRQRAQVAVAFAAVRWLQGRVPDVITWCERSIAEATRAGDREALAHAYYLLDAAHVALGEVDRAVWSSTALAIYEELGDLWGQGVVLNNLGTQAYWEGRWDDAIALYERGREARERIGDAVNASMGTVNVAEILVDQGRLEEAEPVLKKVLRIRRAADDRAGAAYALGLLGRVTYGRGSPDEAIELLSEARSTFLDVGIVQYAVEMDGRIGQCHVLAGDPAATLEVVDRALAQLRTCTGAAVFGPMLHRVRGQALARLGDLAGCREALSTSLATARSRALDYETALTTRVLARLAELAAEPAEHLWAESNAVLGRLGVVSVVDAALDSEPMAASDAVIVLGLQGAARRQAGEPAATAMEAAG